LTSFARIKSDSGIFFYSLANQPVLSLPLAAYFDFVNNTYGNAMHHSIGRTYRHELILEATSEEIPNVAPLVIVSQDAMAIHLFTKCTNTKVDLLLSTFIEHLWNPQLRNVGHKDDDLQYVLFYNECKWASYECTKQALKMYLSGSDFGPKKLKYIR
jgi:hypothetical protein